LRQPGADLGKDSRCYSFVIRYRPCSSFPQPFVSSDYVAASTAKHNSTGVPRRPAYGYLWWLTQTNTGQDAFVASGLGSQLIYVVPKLDLITAMASSSSVTGGSLRLINDVVLPAASIMPSPPTCIARLGGTLSDFR
jgi:CubicO group peptidase (beta-lactamase class C family)